MDFISTYTNATELLEQGKTKDAYVAFLSIIESSTQQLHHVKFVHQTIVSTPIEYENSIHILKSSINQLEKITTHHYLPGANIKKPIPPPLPPKPSKINKPLVPPKPNKKILSIDTQHKSNTRSRGNSVSFAKELDIIENNSSYTLNLTEEDNNHEDDDDDDDEEELQFNVSDNNLSLLNSKLNKDYIHNDFMQILLETNVNPSHLVPAQTNTRDSLSLPSNNQSNDYIPNIPSPPLLATHRSVQQRLNDLESSSIKKQDLIILTRQTLERVRTLYMSAMTIPSILQFSSHLIAYQLTLIESSIFRAIPKHALLSHSARTPHKKVVASTDFFNFMTRSIEHSILLPQEITKRGEILNRWIKVARKLLLLNNYQTLKAIVSALGTPPIQRLKRTWDTLPKKKLAHLELLQQLMSESDNYKKYREHLPQSYHQPIVPFLGVFIHDLTYISVAAKGNEEDSRVQEVLNLLQSFQSCPPYPRQPPQELTSLKKNLMRPMSDALHFVGSASKKSNESLSGFLVGNDQRQEFKIELEQQLMTQYVLMRPWTTEKTIDSLSLLREPTKPRSISSPTSSRFSVDRSSTSSVTSNLGSPITSYSSSPTYLGSFTKISEESESRKVGFWPFRKSSDLNRSLDSPHWSDHPDLKPSTTNRHSRSFSLPSKSFDLSEIYHEQKIK